MPDFEAFPDLFTSGHLIFSRLLNPDWSIQISRAPAVCKVIEIFLVFLLTILGNRWRFWWNSNFNFSGTVILQLWLLSLVPFRHFAISPFCHFVFLTRPPRISIDRKSRELAPKTMQEYYLYDPRPIEQRLMTARHVLQLIADMCVLSLKLIQWLQYFKNCFPPVSSMGEFFGSGLSVRKSVKGYIYPPGFVATVYNEDLNLR